jgi:ADP-glucose pyrophosphorylase
MDHVGIGKGSHLSGGIVDTGTKIGEDVTIVGNPQFAVPLLSAGSFIPSGSRPIFSG